MPCDSEVQPYKTSKYRLDNGMQRMALRAAVTVDARR
jgi:hypothetical protein